MENNIIIAEGDQVNGQDIIVVSSPTTKRTIESIKNDEVVLCRTKQQAEEFCKLLHASGKKWRSGEGYDSITDSHTYSGKLCYDMVGTCGALGYYDSMGWTISFATEFIVNDAPKEPTIYDMVKEIHQKLTSSPSYAPYQLCPLCNGAKHVPSMGTTTTQTCGICKGNGIIPQHAL